MSVTFPATAASAAPGSKSPVQVAVIPPDPVTNAVDDQIIMAGATGFLHQQAFSGTYLWTTYASGQSSQVPALAGIDPGTIKPVGGDIIGFTVQPASNPLGHVSEFDLATMAWLRWNVPAGYFAVREFGTDALVYSRSGGVLTWGVLDLSTQVVTTISGLPAAARVGYPEAVGDASAVVLPYFVSGTGEQFALLDLASAKLASIPDADTNGQALVLSADRVALFDLATDVVAVYSRAGLSSGTDTTAVSVTLPHAPGYLVALAGDHVLAVQDTAECLYCVYTTKPALDVPLFGAQAGQSGQALAQAQTGLGSIAQAPGGAALVVGGSGPGDWAVRQFTVDGSDNLSDTPVLRLTGPVTNGGLSISEGLVRHIELEPVPGGAPLYLLFNHALAPDSGQVGVDPGVYGGILTSPVPCTKNAACLRTVDGNYYGTSYIGKDSSTGSIDVHEQIDGNTSTSSTALPSASDSVVDASIDYVIVDGSRPARQYLVYPGYQQVFHSGPVTGAALWFDTLWTSDGRGFLRPRYLSVDTLGTAGKPIATGSACTATEIQVTERWIYWSCGASGPAGVYDLRRHRDISVPAGPALLGDGYLVRHDPATGNLNLYDIHTDSLHGPVTLANVPAGAVTDGRGITWAVDKYSGDVAYVAADDSIHVIDTGVPATPPAIANPLTDQGPGGTLAFGPSGGWSATVLFSRPITGSITTIRRLATGQRVATRSGGPARIGMVTQWNGYLADHKKAFSGRYAWSVTVRTADGAPPVTVQGGVITVYCGQIPFRSMDCDGAPALLAVGSFNPHYAPWAGFWYQGTPQGKLATMGYTENWPLCPERFCVADIVPFGDFNGDGYSDLLVLNRNGVLRAYLGFGQAYFNSQGAKSIKIGTGWSRYNALAYPGDLTRDGRPDLVARDKQGRLWLYASTGKGSFRNRREIGRGWGRYVRLIGAGDLTGDGIGDLLAITKNGTMWRYDGNGRGGFRDRRLVSSGWSKYNVVIGIGDLNNDGCNDLVARSRRGGLWLFAGNCRGGFAQPKLISAGWRRFQGLF